MFKSHTRPTLVKARFPKFFFSPKISKISKDLPRKKKEKRSLRLSIEISKVATHLWPKITPCSGHLILGLTTRVQRKPSQPYVRFTANRNPPFFRVLLVLGDHSVKWVF